METVLVRFDIEHAVAYRNGIVGFKSVQRDNCVICSAGYLHIVLAGDAVPVIGIDIQNARAVQNKIVLRKYDRVGVGLAVRSELPADG